MERAYWEDKKDYHILHLGNYNVTLWKPGMVSQGLFNEKVDAYVFSGNMPGDMFLSYRQLTETDVNMAKRKVVEIFLQYFRKAAEEHKKMLELCSESTEALEEMLSGEQREG